MTQAEPKPDGKRIIEVSDIVRWLEDYRKENPLGPNTGFKADKAFYDSLCEDELGDGQFQFTDLA
jgi:hypothetical protein